jgi:hypothetical protein
MRTCASTRRPVRRRFWRSRSSSAIARAASLGFDEALANPPAFADLEAAALRCLAKPTAVKIT